MSRPFEALKNIQIVISLFFIFENVDFGDFELLALSSFLGSSCKPK